jgi:putative oxidoreductase
MKKLFSTRINDRAFSFGMFLLRVAAGSLMLVDHGLDKLLHFSEYATKFSDPFHLGRTVSLAMVVFAEFFCAAFVVLGLFTRLAAIPLIIAMGVALFFAHKGEFYGAGEGAGLYMIIFICILVM